MEVNALLKDLTIDDFKQLIEVTVIHTLNDYFDDLEERENLKEDVIKKLENFRKKRINEEYGIPADEVYKELNL
jgi:hypothetical protein